MLLKEFTGFFSLLLEFGAVLCFAGYALDTESMDNLFLGIVLAVVVTVTSVFSYIQTSKAASLMADFKNFIPKESIILRDGQWQKIEARLIVPGDIIRINVGDSISADVILLEAAEMKVNNASLTGESEDLLRDVKEHRENIFESPNVAFFGTQCTSGTGIGLVFKTGDDTVIGRIAGLTTSADTTQTTLNAEIERFIKFISAIAIALGISFFILGIIIGYPIITDVIFAIGIIVANVPEGLLATVTVSLALTARRMAKKFVLVKNLEAVETLGSTSCICSDKTGTLTQNRMTVSQMFYCGHITDCTTNFEIYKRLEKLENEKGDRKNMDNVPIPKYNVEDSTFQTVVKTIALASVSYFNYQPSSEEIRNAAAKKLKTSAKKLPKDVTAESDPHIYKIYKEIEQELIRAEASKPYMKKKVEGDASETGLVKFIAPLLDGGEFGCYNLGGLQGFRSKYPIMKANNGDPAMIPFNSENKFNLIIRDMNTDQKKPTTANDNMYIYLKGAPEKVLARCSTMLVEGDKEVPITDAHKMEIKLANDKFGGMGERVLAFARYKLNPDKYPKNPQYPFNIKDWKSPDFKEGAEGWYPMSGL